MREIVKSVAGDCMQTVQFVLADFDKSHLLCKDARYDSVWLSLSDVTGKKNSAH